MTTTIVVLSTINSLGTASGEQVVGSNPTKYQAEWDITRVKGRWSIGVESPHRGNTTSFKVDKRGQIVELANSWVGATPAQLGSASANCNDLTAVIYSHLGLPLPGGNAGTQAQYDSANFSCSGDGCLLFYSGIGAPVGNVAHVAISSGGQRININSNTTPGSPVVVEDVNAGVLTGVPNPYKAQIQSRSTTDLGED
ncbi:hypothetical protein [Abditibacterium utsteinense]|nr:hypothetical protein [Abditibacterium utsteinense]